MRGVRQRENGSWVVERVIGGKRRPKTVKTKKEAVRLKNADKARRRAEKEPSHPLAAPARRFRPAVPQSRPSRLPRDALQLANGNWVVLIDGQVLMEDVAPTGENLNGDLPPIPQGWTLGEAFDVAFRTPKHEGGFLGQKGRMAEIHADTIKAYFDEEFPIENIRCGTGSDHPSTRTLDGLLEALRDALELDFRPNKHQSIRRTLGTLRKTLQLAVANGRLAALPEFPSRVPADEPTFEARYSSDYWCFMEIWHAFGVKADPHFTVQLALRRRSDQGIVGIVALLRNINERLKRVEQALARRKLARKAH